MTGTCTRHEVATVWLAGAVVAIGASLLLHGPATWVVLGGMAIVVIYSGRPVRLADRGAVASMVLPAGYVAVPYLLGILAVRSDIHLADLQLLVGLYVGFIGRIVLKDFRDVRGLDTLFGKRTFLVRYGGARRARSAQPAGSRD